MRWRKALRARVGLLALLGWTSGTPARLDGAVLRNDSVEDFSEVFIQVGFLANERAAAWLTSTCDGNLTAVQVLWLSLTGGAGQTLGNAITVSQAGSFPDPGAELAQLVGPALNDGFFNEYPVVPSIPVSLWQTLVVDFEFFEAPPSRFPTRSGSTPASWVSAAISRFARSSTARISSSRMASSRAIPPPGRAAFPEPQYHRVA
jgi:hypothetical protein